MILITLIGFAIVGAAMASLPFIGEAGELIYGLSVIGIVLVIGGMIISAMPTV